MDTLILNDEVSTAESFELEDLEVQSFAAIADPLVDQPVNYATHPMQDPACDASCGEWVCFVTPSICGSC